MYFPSQVAIKEHLEKIEKEGDRYFYRKMIHGKSYDLDDFAWRRKSFNEALAKKMELQNAQKKIEEKFESNDALTIL